MRHLKIESLPNAKTWLDRDEIMLHACFQILQDFIDKEQGDTHCDYEAHKDFVDEVRFLYNWWQIRKSDEFAIQDILIDNFEEDDEMIIRLMKIRGSLWT